MMRMVQPVAKRRWFRFSLRMLLVAVTVLCVWLGFKVNAARREKESVEAIRKIGGLIMFDYQVVPMANGKPDDFTANAALPGPDWLRTLIGEEYLRKVAFVQLKGRPQVTTSDLAELAKLSALRRLTLIANYKRHYDEADFEMLSQLNSLTHLEFNEGVINENGFASLLNLKHLRILSITCARWVMRKWS